MASLTIDSITKKKCLLSRFGHFLERKRGALLSDFKSALFGSKVICQGTKEGKKKMMPPGSFFLLLIPPLTLNTKNCDGANAILKSTQAF